MRRSDRHLPEHLEIQGRATISSGDHQPIQPAFPGYNEERLKAPDKDDVDGDDDSDSRQTLAGYYCNDLLETVTVYLI